MYKRWIIEQDSSTNTRVRWLKKVFTEFEKILTDIGIEFKSYYDWNYAQNTSSSSLNCSSNNLTTLSSKGYPEWAVEFTSYPNINLSGNNINSWKDNETLKNYINGFLSFKIEDIDYCFVYRLGSDSSGYYYSDLLVLIKYNNDRMYSQTIDYSSLGINPNVENNSSSTVTGIGKWGIDNHILVEYHKNDFINMINLTFNGLTTLTNGDYYSDGKFISLGTYKLSDNMNISFPGGFLAKTDNLDSTMFNKLCFVTDSQGLTTLINGNLGDQITGNYIKGNIYYGIKNTRILGKLENAITINNYNFETGTIFTYNGHRYGKIKIPMINNEICNTTDYTKYGAALSLAFHKDIYEDTESN